ncbi:MAG TPA: nucleoside 2-deoxyribosyltransferase [Candidatus Dojkabacteria bacterium]|jgi:nucleoside 2-deoxyribosyltransferase|nr:nucleoside 2-deoxyribosyltransferase [Candidatus Dojkabacteria bacterium]
MEKLITLETDPTLKKIFIICSVRGASPEYREKLESYVEDLEKRGCKVHLPHRDTNQQARGYDICKQNMEAIRQADEVHIFYSSASQGTHFDMGVAFALGKPIVVVENEEYGEGKSYSRMLAEWGEADKE